MESSEQGNNRKRKIALKMAEKRKLETPQQHQKRVEKMLEYSRNQKNGNNRKNRINGISLLNEFEGEILDMQKYQVPRIPRTHMKSLNFWFLVVYLFSSSSYWV